MTDSASGGSGDAARMVLEPDAVHEGDGEPYLDCPACGSQVSLTQIIEEGHCTGHLEGEGTEVEDGEQFREEGCTAELSLELVWGE